MSKSMIVIAALCAVCCVISSVEGRTPLLVECPRYEWYLQQGEAPNCDAVCSELGKPCTITYIQAPSGCYCMKGYARDSNNKCIDISRCPAN